MLVKFDFELHWLQKVSRKIDLLLSIFIEFIESMRAEELTEPEIDDDEIEKILRDR